MIGNPIMEAQSMNGVTRLALRHKDYDALFATALGQLRDERRYRVFADLERKVGAVSLRDLAFAKRPARRRDLVLE